MENFSLVQQPDPRARMMLTLQAIDNELFAHHDAEKNRSYLGEFMDLFYHPDRQTMDDLKKLSQEAKQRLDSNKLGDVAAFEKEAVQEIKKDQGTEHFKNEVFGYAGTAMKIAPMFMHGGYAWGATGAMFALDQAHPNDGIGTQLLDGTLGAAKGLAMKGIIEGIGGESWNVGVKGAAMGFSNRIVDGALTRQTWTDKTGRFSPVSGFEKMLGNATDPATIVSDVLVFGAAAGLGAIAQKFIPAIGASPFLATTTTAGIFGVTSGAAGEISRERAAGQSIDWRQVALRGGLEGGVYALAAIPGGLQGEFQMRSMQKQMEQDRLQQVAAEGKDQPVTMLTAEQTDALYKELSGNGEYTFEKRGYTATVTKAAEAQEIRTIKGDVEQAKAGDLIVTRTMDNGAVDQYLISLAKLDARWEPAEGQAVGESGVYRTKPSPTQMVELSGPTRIWVKWGPDGVNGTSGDFLAQYGPGDYNIVHGVALAETYVGANPASIARFEALLKSIQTKPPTT